MLRQSLMHWAGRGLVVAASNAIDAARAIFHMPFAVVSHGMAANPFFDYANQTALRLFGMSWEEFTHLPSRLSAEAVSQDDRARLLAEVATKGFIDHYSGVRISSTGKRFMIGNAIVWNTLDKNGAHCGQAAQFRAWKYL